MTARAEALAARVALASVFALLAVLAFRQVGSLDTGFHLRAGERILSGAGWPTNDPFTYTLGDRPYVDTSWGYQVALAAIYRGAGARGLVVLDVALVLAAFFLTYRTARLAPVRPALLAAVLLIGALASELRFETRPELASFVYLAAVLHILYRRAESLPSPLWALPLLHLCWANTHALFVLGWAALACFIVSETIRERKAPRDLLAWGAASVAAVLVNPYGIRGLLFPFTLATRLQEKNAFAQSIGEFASPFDLRLSTQFPFYPRVPITAFRLFFVAALVAAVLAALPTRASGRPRRLAPLLLFIAFAPLAARMVRNVPLVVLACLPATIWMLAAPRLRAKRDTAVAGRASRLQVAVALAVTIAALAIGARVTTDAYYIAARRLDRFGDGWNPLTVPLDAAAFAQRAGLSGRMLNHLNFGGYLMWALPQPVFIDGRLEVVGEEFYGRYQAILADAAAMESAVRRYGIEWIVFPYATNPQLLGRLSRDARWRIAYFDHLAAIFVREGPGAQAKVDRASMAAIGSTPPPPDLQTLPGLGDPPRRGPAARWAQGLVRRQSFPSEEFARGLFFYFRDALPHAADRFAAAVRASDGAYYEVYNNLGSALWKQGRRAEAAACYRIVLADDPGNPVARPRLESMSR